MTCEMCFGKAYGVTHFGYCKICNNGLKGVIQLGGKRYGLFGKSGVLLESANTKQELKRLAKPYFQLGRTTKIKKTSRIAIRSSD